jgi:predicted acetyltransferase
MAMECGAVSGEAETLALSRILAWAFGIDAADTRLWLDHAGLENVRVARKNDEILGGLAEIPMGQWFGGRSVPLLGLAGVGVAPAARGERVALTLVLDSLRGARQRGFALSALYPATLTLYRAAGYELAGSRHRYSADLDALPTARGALTIEPLGVSDTPAVEALYGRIASERAGYLARGPYVWQRVRETRKGELHPAFGIHGAHGLEGYVYLSARSADDQRELLIHDAAVATPAAAARLLAFFADHRSTIKRVVFCGGLPDPLLLAVPERPFRVSVAETWMLRVLEPKLALEARGYPELDASVDFELADGSLPENSGRFRLDVRGGRGRVTPGGDGAVALDERALAALYAGFATPALLARTASFRADAATLGRLAALFAGPAPAMVDFF